MRAPLHSTLLSCLLFAALHVCAGCAYRPTQSLAFRPTEVDFSKLRPGAHQFELRLSNSGESPVDDLRLARTCGCISELKPFGKFSIQSQNAMSISFSIHAEPKKEMNQAITVLDKDGRTLAVLRLRGTPLSPMSLEDKIVELNRLSSVREAKLPLQELKLVNGVQIRGVSAVSSWLKVGIKKIDGKTYLSGTILPNASEGLNVTPLIFRCFDGKDEFDLELPFKIDLQSTYMFSRSSIWLGVLRSRETIKRTIELKTKRPFGTLSVIPSTELVEAKVVKRDPQNATIETSFRVPRFPLPKAMALSIHVDGTDIGQVKLNGLLLNSNEKTQ